MGTQIPSSWLCPRDSSHLCSCGFGRTLSEELSAVAVSLTPSKISTDSESERAVQGRHSEPHEK